jgi:hypothetical protein
MAYTTIDKPTDYFNTLLYTGNGSNPRTLTGVGFQPDWVWLKNRTDANGHTLADSVRGANKTLSADGSGVEVTDKSDGHLDAFTSDGFTVGAGTDDARVNNSGSNYVAWNWLASNTTASNTDGSTTSTVSANTTAGFSIVSWTGTGSATTVGHGLGAVPQVFIIKNRSVVGEWGVYHHSLTNAEQVSLFLDLDFTVSGTSSARYNNTAPTSSVFSLGSGSLYNGSGNNMIAYCFADTGNKFFKAGSYTGNGSTDGVFCFTGMRPAWIMGKRTDSANNWYMFDSTRNTSNPTDKKLRADTSDAENVNSSKTIDILSNGFKVRSSDEEFNASGGSYIYLSFAENPFVTSTGIPTTAR